MKLSRKLEAACLKLADTQEAKLPLVPKLSMDSLCRTTVSWVVTLRIPGLVVQSEMNERCHWTTRANRFSHQKATVGSSFSMVNIPTAPSFTKCVVYLTRIGARDLDSDNLAGAFKAVRDRVASWLGVNDGSERVKWEYSQARGKPGIEIRVEGGDQ